MRVRRWLGDSWSPGQLVNSGREIAFNRSRSGLIRDSSNKKNLNHWQRDDASSSSLISSSDFSVGTRGFEETDFWRWGERQQLQYLLDIAFERNSPQQYGTNNDLSIGDNYYKERQDQIFETKSTTFGQMHRVPPPSQTRQQQQNGLNRLQMDSDNDMIQKEQSQQQQSETVPQQRQRKNDHDKIKTISQTNDGWFHQSFWQNIHVVVLIQHERGGACNEGTTFWCTVVPSCWPSNQALGGGGRGGGENITLGTISSRSYTSTINVGNSSSMSSRDERDITGQGALIANEDGITRLQVDVDGRIVDVPCNR